MTDTLTELRDFIASYTGLTGAEALRGFLVDLNRTNQEVAPERAVAGSWSTFRMGSEAPKKRPVSAGVNTPKGVALPVAYVDPDRNRDGFQVSYFQIGQDFFSVSYPYLEKDHPMNYTEFTLTQVVSSWEQVRGWSKVMFVPTYPVGSPEFTADSSENSDARRVAEAIAGTSVEDVLYLLDLYPEETQTFKGLALTPKDAFEKSGLRSFVLEHNGSTFRLDVPAKGSNGPVIYRDTEEAVLYEVQPTTETVRRFTPVS